MRPIDADALKEAFADVLDKNYMDDYAKGFVAGLNVILNMPTLELKGGMEGLDK